MSQFSALLTIAGLALLICLFKEVARYRALRVYWNRPCMGLRWRRQFPNAQKTEIREFLTLFVNAFGFGTKRRLCFSPTDQVLKVYGAFYPALTLDDDLELETLVRSLEERYSRDFEAIWRADITLGELFEYAKREVA